MLKTMLASLRSHRARLALSSVAIILGVGFAAGSFVLTDTMRSAFYDAFAQDAQSLDVVAVPSGNGDSLPRSTLGRVRGADGVAAADGRVQGFATLIGENGRPANGDGAAAADGMAMVDSVDGHRALRWQDVAAGQLPNAPGEIAIGKKIAAQHHFAVGNPVTVLDADGHRHRYTLTGTVDLGDSPQYAGKRYLAMTAPAAAEVTGSQGYARVDVQAREGADPATVRSAVAVALGGKAKAYTGDQYAQHQVEALSLGQISIGLLAFAAVAMFVAAIVIANTFTILVAQRTREMALLRCVGATRRQVYTALLGESALLGALGSAVGVAVGIGIGWLAQVLLDAVGVPIPTGPVAVSATGVVGPLLVGMVVTVAAAALPAIAATRIAPVAALRTQPGVDGRRHRRTVRVVLASLALLAGVVGMLPGLLSDGGQSAFLLAIAGGALAFVGVLLLTPVIVPVAIRAVGWVVARPFRTPGELARMNAVRNPGRAASTTAALLVGVTLISIMTVASASLQKTATSALDQQYPYDLAVTARHGHVPAPVVDALRGDKEFNGVLAIKAATATVAGSRAEVQGVDPRLARRVLGSAGGYDAVAPGRVVVPKLLAHNRNVTAGDSITLRFPSGHALHATVADTVDGENVVVSRADLARAAPSAPTGAVFLTVGSGVSAADAQQAAEDAAANHPRLAVNGPLQFKASITQAVDTMVLVFAGLLGVAVLIALVGIANTLALSVLERTRESAMLRALGFTRGQLRAMLSGEAVLMAVVAGVLGVLLGVAFGAVAVRSIVGSTAGLEIVVPYARLGLFVGLAALAGLVASLLPARKAARASIVGAMAVE